MDAFTPMTTRDVLGLALLAALSERPRSRAAAVETVRALCLPWLTLIREAVGGLVSDYCAARYLAARYLHEKGDPRNLADAEFEGLSRSSEGSASPPGSGSPAPSFGSHTGSSPPPPRCGLHSTDPR